MKNTTPFYIEINLSDYDKINDNDLSFIKLNQDKSEYVVDNGLNTLTCYVYDKNDRCIEKIIYDRTYELTFEVEDETNLLYQYNSTVQYKYLPDQPFPFKAKYKEFWVAYKYDKDFRLTQAVTSKGSTFQQFYDENNLVEKRYKIPLNGDTIEYVFKYHTDDNFYVYEYEDSEGNFWNEDLGFKCPFESPNDIRLKFNDNIKFI
jgi:hypothetical protein